MIQRPIRSRQVQQILEIEDPALANLWITQAYHDLEAGLARVFGPTDATWCGFAIWASRTAGRSIRGDYLPARLREIFGQSHSFQAALARSGARWNPSRLLGMQKPVDHGGLFAGLDAVANRVRDAIASGNRRVFGELGPIFAHMIETFGDDTARRPEVLEELLKAHVDPIDRTGELRVAISGYYEALSQSDPVERAQRVMLANCRAVLHEQRELQESIARAMDAPVDHVLEHLSYRSWVRRLPHWLQALLDFAHRVVVRETRDRWEEFMTETVMTIRTSDEVLALGRDVPPLPNGERFPEALRDPRGDLAGFLAEWDRTGGSGVGSGARDWEELDDRMTYITNLFRSRQQHAALRAEPYTPSVRADMEAGRVPEVVE